MSLPKIVAYTAIATTVGIGAGLLAQRHLQGQRPPPAEAAMGKAHGTVEVLPDFRFPDLHGREYDNVRWAGDWLLLYFWATWCKPCTLDLTTLANLQRAYAARGLRVAAVAIDDPKAVRAWAANRDLPYPILLGAEPGIGLMRDLGDRFQTLPYAALFNPHGHLVYRHPGALDAQEIVRRVHPKEASKAQP